MTLGRTTSSFVGIAVLAIALAAGSGAPALGATAPTKTAKKSVAKAASSKGSIPATTRAPSTSKPTTIAPTTVAPTTAVPPTTAKPSGSITVYSGRNEALVKPILEQFTADTGIKVNFRAGDSGALGAQILTEGKASPADIFFSQDAGALGAVSKAGLFDALPTSLTERVAKGFRAKDNRWVGVSGRLRVVIYNPSLASPPPPTIDDVLDEKWKGKIGFAPTNASWQSFVTALRVVRGEAAAKAWLVKFKANNPKAYSGNAVVRDAVNKGEVAIGLINHYYFYEKIAVETRAEVVAKNQYFKNGDLGGLMNVAGVGVLKTSENKPAALKLVDYLLSRKAQTYFAEKTYEYPLISSVAAVADIPQLSTVNPPDVDLSDLDSLAATQELLASTGLLTR
jgi:iron(III) transport system substrate-binding protein